MKAPEKPPIRPRRQEQTKREAGPTGRPTRVADGVIEVGQRLGPIWDAITPTSQRPTALSTRPRRRKVLTRCRAGPLISARRRQERRSAAIPFRHLRTALCRIEELRSPPPPAKGCLPSLVRASKPTGVATSASLIVLVRHPQTSGVSFDA